MALAVLFVYGDENMGKARELAREALFLIAMVVVFLAVSAMETENVVVCTIVAVIAAIVAWICVDKSNANINW